jgi:hypothetical protein
VLTAVEPLLLRGRHDVPVDDDRRRRVVEDRVDAEDPHVARSSRRPRAVPEGRQAASGSLVGREPMAPWSLRIRLPGEALVTQWVVGPEKGKPFARCVFT